MGLIFGAPAWFLLRIVIGYCMAGLFMVLESWFNDGVSNEKRGQTFAYYMVSSLGAFAVGPFLVNLGDPTAYPLFAMTAILFNLCLLPIALTRKSNPVITRAKRLKLRELVKLSPLGVAGCVAAGLVNSAVYGLGAVYADLEGLSDGGVSLFFSAIILGGLAMQLPVGWLSDRYDRRSTMLGLICCAMGFALLIVVFGAWSLPLLTILSFAFGDMMGPIYGLSVAQTNDYVEKDQFVAVSSGLLIAYSLGAIAGPNIASWLMNGVGPIGLWLYVAVILLGLGGYTVYRVRRHTALPVKEQGNYVAVAGETPLAGELDPRAPTLASQAQNGHQTPPAGPNMAPMGPKADRNRTM